MSSPSPREMANAIRALSMDAVQKANSGHPGCPMGMADIAQVLWKQCMRYNPKNPHWVNRDRFILSNGHGSMLLYAALHLTGYDVSLDDIKQFRQLNSKTPGHPEVYETPGVETTTGPLGQGLANAVGMALGEQQLGLSYNKPDCEIIDHHTYVFLGDGCLMEGISHEACSLAGTLKLGKLIALYDDNHISIDGDVKGWFTDDTPARFRAYGWHVIGPIDGHDHKAVSQALVEAKAETAKPTLICCKTQIGYGSPNVANTAKAHGAPLGDDEIALTKKALGWQDAAFVIPKAQQEAWDHTQAGSALEAMWQAKWEQYQEKYPLEAQELSQRLSGQIEPAQEALSDLLQQSQDLGKDLATRQASQWCLDQLVDKLPGLFGGSADLTGSNGTLANHSRVLRAGQSGNYCHYGVREFGMAALMNGLALYGGFIPFGGTFLTFVDYQRNALRLAALMQTRSIFVLTHDSIGLGEDGPTHQPIEHLAMLRATPNVHVWRPCDTTETVVSWEAALYRDNGPTALCLSRQKCVQQKRSASQLSNVRRGGYVLFDTDEPQVILIASGSEVEICIQVAKQAATKDIAVRVVSMPCVEVFKQQSDSYQQSVLPTNLTRRIAVEAAHPMSWYEFVGTEGRVIGLEQFGKSAPAEELFAHFGLTAEHIIQQVESLLEAQLA